MGRVPTDVPSRTVDSVSTLPGRPDVPVTGWGKILCPVPGSGVGIHYGSDHGTGGEFLFGNTEGRVVSSRLRPQR